MLAQEGQARPGPPPRRLGPWPSRPGALEESQVKGGVGRGHLCSQPGPKGTAGQRPPPGGPGLGEGGRGLHWA